MPIYEYQFGVHVKAEDAQAAWKKVRPVSEQLDEIDAEGDSATDGPFLVSVPTGLDEALWGEDAAAVRAAVEALHGHHPERGGPEREQAAFAVVRAVKKARRATIHVEYAEDQDDLILPNPDACYGGSGPFVIPIMDDTYGGIIAWAATEEQAARIVAALRRETP